jgi:hypothetical protein
MAAGCKIEPPSGRIACVEVADCPPGFFCSERADGSKRCTRDAQDVPLRPDAAVVDAGWDAAPTPDDAGERDSGVRDADADAMMRDAQQADTSTPTVPPDAGREPDAGRDPGDVLGGNELPDHIKAPLPACGGEPDPETAYFVSAGVGEDIANCGGPEGPCRSLSKALQRAVDDGVVFIYLDNTEVFMETEPLRLPANVVVAGGFSNVNGRWTRLCDAARGKTRLASSGNPVLVAEYTGASKLTSLSVETRAAEAGESMIGLLARGLETKLWLDNVVIAAADGGSGAAGAAGAAGAVPSTSCEPSDGLDGETAGASGAHAAAGTFGPEGYAPGRGEPGGVGAVGHAGVLAPEPQCLPCGGDCSPGGETCGQRGSSGCGGAAGSGGEGGFGGGSSVALYTWDAQVFVAGGTLRAGSGGAAGDGGAAGGGATGSAGSVGAAGEACYACWTDWDYCSQCEQLQAPGTQGGNGGSGREGGPGGAGAGGFAYAAYRGGAAKLTIAKNTKLEFGAAGTSSAGAPGLAAALGP